MEHGVPDSVEVPLPRFQVVKDDMAEDGRGVGQAPLRLVAVVSLVYHIVLGACGIVRQLIRSGT